MRRVLVVATTLALASTLTSCASGPNAATRQVNQVTDGVEKQVVTGGVDLRINNITVVLTPAGDAVLVGTLANRGKESDSLLGVVINGNQATLTGLQDLKQYAPITFEGDIANAKAVVKSSAFVAGHRTTVTLGFAKAGLVNLDAMVREADGIYANITA